MKISIIQLSIPFSFTLNNVYCAPRINRKSMYNYTIKEYSVALVANNQMEVDMHITLIPKTTGTGQHNKITKPNANTYSFDKTSQPFVRIHNFIIYNETGGEVPIIENNSHFISGKLELPNNEELGLHITYKYDNPDIFNKIDNDQETYRFQFELVFDANNLQQDLVNERYKKFFSAFCEKYSDQGNKIVLENKFKSNEKRIKTGMILKFTPKSNHSIQESVITCYFDNHESEEEGSNNNGRGSQNDNRNPPLRQNNSQNKDDSSTTSRRSDSETDTQQSYTHSRSSSDIGPANSVPSNTKPNVPEPSIEYEYQEINFFTTVAGVSMLIHSIMGVILVILPALYKLWCIYFSSRT